MIDRMKMLTVLAECQQVAQAFADSVEWWEDCTGIWKAVTRTMTGMIFDKQGIEHNELCCAGTGKVLRYPHLFEAMYEEEHVAGCAVWQVPYRPCTCSGYAVRSVVEIWWRLPEAMKMENLGYMMTDLSVAVEEALIEANEQHPILATFAALEKVIGRKP